MSQKETGPLEDTLVYEDQLPLRWEERSDQGTGENLTRIAERNERLLRCINLLAEQGYEKPEEEGEYEALMVRLETKVDLLLDLFSRLGPEAGRQPEPTLIRLAAGGIEWRCSGAAPRPGQSVWIHLFLEPRLPDSVQLPGRILEIEKAGETWRVLAGFEALGEAVQNHLEKMIFRHHRRLIAQQRPGSPAGD